MLGDIRGGLIMTDEEIKLKIDEDCAKVIARGIARELIRRQVYDEMHKEADIKVERYMQELGYR
jgi:hypothetical protein